MSQLNSALQQCKDLTTEYKSQLECYRKKSEELGNQLHKKEQENQFKLQESKNEVNEVSVSKGSSSNYEKLISFTKRGKRPLMQCYQDF